MQLKKNVEDDYRKWKAGIVGGMNEQELINSFAGEWGRGVHVRAHVCVRAYLYVCAYVWVW